MWNNHFLSQNPRRELSVYCCIPEQHSETEAHWDSETAHKQSVESCSAPQLAPAARIDCKKMRTDQSRRKVRADKRGKYHRNIIHVKEDVGLRPRLAQTTGRISTYFNWFWIIFQVQMMTHFCSSLLFVSWRTGIILCSLLSSMILHLFIHLFIPVKHFQLKLCLIT